MNDRALICEILIDRGAPAADLEYLLVWYPTPRDAEDYRPPAREAWCPACDGLQPTDLAGCLTCRERDA